MKPSWVLLTLMLVCVSLCADPKGNCSIPSVNQCSYVKEHCGDVYLDGYYCFSESEKVRHWVVLPFFALLLILLFTGLGITSSRFLCPNISTFSNVIGIPETVSGLTLLSFGNGSPDLVGTYASFISNNSALAAGELIGSAFFITTVIIGTIAIANPFSILSRDQLSSHKNEKYTYIRELVVFIAAVTIVLGFLSDGELTLYECIILILIYVAYVSVVIGWSWGFHILRKDALHDRMVRSLYSQEDRDDFFGSLNFVDDQVIGFRGFEPTSRPSLLDTVEMRSLEPEQPIRLGSVPLSSPKRKVFEPPYSDPGFRPYSDDPSVEPMPDEDFESKYKALYTMIPDLSHFREENVFAKAATIFTLPMVVVLRLTVPVRQERDFDDLPNPLEITLLSAQCFLAVLLFGVARRSVVGVLAGLAAALLSSGGVYWCFKRSKLIKAVNMALCILGFVSSIHWIAFFAEEVVEILQFASFIFETSEAVMGLTVFAIGNSLGDLVSNFIIARMGYPLMALAACFGGPLLNLLLGIGVNGLIVVLERGLMVDFSLSLLISGVALVCNLLFLLLVVPANGWMLDRWIGGVAIAIWVVGTTINVCISG